MLNKYTMREPHGQAVSHLQANSCFGVRAQPETIHSKNAPDNEVKGQMRRILKFVGWYLVISTAATIGMLIFSFPNYPKSVAGWMWFFLLALPVTLFGELIGEAAWRNPIAQRIEERTSNRSISWLRICYGFVVMLFLLGCACGISFYFGVHE